MQLLPFTDIRKELTSIARERDINALLAAWNLDVSHIKGSLAKINHIEEWIHSVKIEHLPHKDCRIGPYFYIIQPISGKKSFKMVKEPVFLSVTEEYFYQQHGYPMPMPYISKENARMRRLFSRSQLSYFALAQAEFDISDIKMVPEMLTGTDLASLYTPFMKQILTALVSAGDDILRLKAALNSFGIGWVETRKTINMNLIEFTRYAAVEPTLKFEPEAIEGKFSLEIIDYLDKLPDKELLRAMVFYQPKPSIWTNILESFGMISTGAAAEMYRRSELMRDILVLLNKENRLNLRK